MIICLTTPRYTHTAYIEINEAAFRFPADFSAEAETSGLNFKEVLAGLFNYWTRGRRKPIDLEELSRLLLAHGAIRSHNDKRNRLASQFWTVHPFKITRLQPAGFVGQHRTGLDTVRVNDQPSDRRTLPLPY